MVKRGASRGERGRERVGSRAAPRDCRTPFVEEVTPWLDPWEVCRRLGHLPHLLFLDSAASHPTLGRYSFVTADPFDWLWARGRRVVDRDGPCQVDPFTALDRKLADWRIV